MKNRYEASSLEQVSTAIAAKPYRPGNGLVVEIVHDGRLIKGVRSTKRPDIASKSDFINSTEPLDSLISCLVTHGQTFVTRVGKGKKSCTIEWSISA